LLKAAVATRWRLVGAREATAWRAL